MTGERRRPPTDGALTMVVTLVVTFVWASSIMAGFLIGSFEAALYTTPLMGAVVGWVTGVRIWRNGSGG